MPSYCLLRIVDGSVGHAPVIWAHLKPELDEVEKKLLSRRGADSSMPYSVFLQLCTEHRLPAFDDNAKPIELRVYHSQ